VKAKEQLEFALIADSNDVSAHFLLGKVLGRDGLYDDMNMHFRRSLELSSKHRDEIQSFRDQIYMHQMNVAINCYNDAVDIKEPKEQKRKNELLLSALEYAAQAREAKPEEPDPIELLALVHIKLKKEDQGIRFFEELLDKDPENVHIWEQIGRINYQKGITNNNISEIEQGLIYYEKVLMKKPDDITIMQNISLGYFILRDIKKARVTFDNAIAKNPKDPDLHFYYGATLHRAGFKEDALEKFKSVIDYSPDKIASYANLSTFYMNVDEWEQASEYLEELVKLDPGNANAWYHLGNCYKNMELMEKAADAYSQEQKVKNKF